jgi:hypothetical protein
MCDLETWQRRRGELNPKITVEFHTSNEQYANTGLVEHLIDMNHDRSYILGDRECSAFDILQHNNFKGWKCTAPGNALCIDYFGKVYKCKAHFQKGASLPFSIFDNFIEKYNNLPKHTTCPLERCTSEIEIIKESI